MRKITAFAALFMTFSVQSQDVPGNTAAPPVVSPQDARQMRFAIENFCLTTARLTEKIAILRDLGVPEVRSMRFVLKGETNDELIRFSTREVRWVYTNNMVEPTIARQLRYTSCMANPPY